MESLKREFLELLDKDLEFRYAVAGYLGLSEILKRLDTLAEEQIKLRREQTRLTEEQAKTWNEIVKLREEQAKMWESIIKIWEEIKALREEQVRLREEQTKIWNEIKMLREEQNKLREDMISEFRHHKEVLERHAQEITKLREDMIIGFRRHDEELAKLREDLNKMYRQIDARLSRVERTLEKITADIEDEARIVVRHRLKDMGYEVEVSALTLPELEINLYGSSNDLCIIGEASVRASSSIIDEINQKIELLREKYPEKLRPKIIKVVYASLALPDLIERAKKESIWVLKATGDIVRLSQSLIY
ncbi:MAG: hypothetical protein QW424_05835 [Candidatus Bathyarchaeia archaeon]